MTLHRDDERLLFVAPPSADTDEGPDPVFDGSGEAMRRLRHPFAVEAAHPAERSPAAEDTA
jgi:hypothetical protein